MEALEAIMTRRSIRRYTSREVAPAQIRRILKAAMNAPSANNLQPWHFVIIHDRGTLEEITTFHQYARMLREAPVAIAVCADTGKQNLEGYWVQDCAAATQNMLLAAHALGLGAVWLGIFPREPRIEGMRRLLKLPEHITPFCVVAMGWPDETVEPASRFQEDRIHTDTW